MIQSSGMLLEIKSSGKEYIFESSIEEALLHASSELKTLNETEDSIQQLTHETDQIDYMLSAGIGALCGIMDIFLIGKPGESPLGNLTDKWVENRTKDFAKLCGWNGTKGESVSKAIEYLEKKFDVPYDQRGAGDSGSSVFGLTPTNHHFKSLAHTPSLLGLFFSILDQFQNSSHFVAGNVLISLVKADKEFVLKGNNIPSKVFSAFTNWMGHLISDASGASSSKGRGMGIPSPLWTWTNDIIAIKRKLQIPTSEFNRSMNELALKMFNQGYDVRFQSAQAIPVFLNEMVVRMAYSTRRLVKYYSDVESSNRSFEELWEKCEPFSNSTVKRMLTIAHGTFCLIDLGDATVRGFNGGVGPFNPIEFFLRVNLVGVGRFTISLYGESKRRIILNDIEKESLFSIKEKIIVENYIEGLTILSEVYDDRTLINFVNDLKTSDAYIGAFNTSVKLAEKRNVSQHKVLKNKAEIDAYFGGEKL